MAIFGCEGLDRVVAITGCAGMSSGGFDMYYHFQFNNSDTFVAGDSFCVGSWKSDTIFTSSDDVVVSWVFEIGSGSGTIRVSSGLDPSEDLTTPGLATDALGTFTIDGPQRLVCGPTAITASDLTSFASEPFAFVEILSGTIEIIQIKMQVWSVDGPAGAWVTAPTWQRTGQVGNTRTTILTIGDGGPHGSNEEAFTAQHVAYEAMAGTDQIFQNPISGGTPVLVAKMIFRVGFDIVGFTGYYGFTSPITGYLFAQPANINFTGPGVLSSGWDPREIRTDTGSVVRAVGGGQLKTVFDHWEDSVLLERGHEDPGFFTAQAVEEPDWGDSITSFPSPPAFVIPWQRPTGEEGPTSDTVSIASLGLAESRVIYFGAFTTGFMGPAGEVTQQITSISLQSTRFTDNVPEYEYWDSEQPWVPEVEYPDPRLFAQDWDGVYYPWGMGKPAGMLKVARIWTPMGMYRDLTYSEYFDIAAGNSPPPGAYPTYIKRYDETLDLVGWMVPAPEDDP